MQAAGYFPTPAPPLHSSTDPVRASVNHLLARANVIPCTAAAQAFSQLVQPNHRFQTALDVLLPLLSERIETPRRILASYILYFLYATHPVAMNPFRTAFIEVFVRERDVARTEADRGGVSDGEQLVWALWKILKGDGNDLGPYSPATLSRSPLPPKLRAAHLTIDDSVNPTEDNNYDGSFRSRQPSPIRTNGLGPSGSHAGTPISATARSPVESGPRSATEVDDAKTEFLEQGMHLLLDACQRVLTLSEQRIVALSLPHFPAHTFVAAHNLSTLISLNPNLGHPVVVALLKVTPDTVDSFRGRVQCLEVLRQLSPTLPSFDIIGRLLRDPTPISDKPTRGTTTVADLVRSDVLGSFILNAIGWIERAEKDSMEGLISDDRISKAVQNLCRFYNSLIKLDIIDPASDVDSAEMAHFALSHAHYEDANALYRVLVMGKF